jgi:hypothetical protein
MSTPNPVSSSSYLSDNVKRLLKEGYGNASSVASATKYFIAIIVSNLLFSYVEWQSSGDTTEIASYLAYATAIVVVIIGFLWLCRLLKIGTLWSSVILLTHLLLNLMEILFGDLVLAIINILYTYGDKSNVIANLVAFFVILVVGWLISVFVKVRTQYICKVMHLKEHPGLTSDEAADHFNQYLQEELAKRNEKEVLGVTVRITTFQEDQPMKHIYLPENSTRIGAKRTHTKTTYQCLPSSSPPRPSTLLE